MSKTLWRISNYSNLDGLGGERTSGRWHTAQPGRRIVYLAEHPALAIIEVLVHLKFDPDLLPDDYQLLEVSINDSLSNHLEHLPDLEKTITQGTVPRATTQSIGDQWLNSGRSPLLVVPSIPAPFSYNYLLNPLHMEAASVSIVAAYHFSYDKRFFKAM